MFGPRTDVDDVRMYAMAYQLIAPGGSWSSTIRLACIPDATCSVVEQGPFPVDFACSILHWCGGTLASTRASNCSPHVPLPVSDVALQE